MQTYTYTHTCLSLSVYNVSGIHILLDMHNVHMLMSHIVKTLKTDSPSVYTLPRDAGT